MISTSGFPYAELVKPVREFDETIILYLPFDEPPLEGSIEFTGSTSKLREFKDSCGKTTLRKDCCSNFEKCKYELIYYQERKPYGNQKRVYEFSHLVRGLNPQAPCSLVGNTYLRRAHSAGDEVILNGINALAFCDVNEMLMNVCNKIRPCLSGGKGIHYDSHTGIISNGYTLGPGLKEECDENNNCTLDTVSDWNWTVSNQQFYNTDHKGNMEVDENWHFLPDGLGYIDIKMEKERAVRFDLDIDCILTADRVNIKGDQMWNTTTLWQLVNKENPSLKYGFNRNISNEISKTMWIDSSNIHLNCIINIPVGEYRFWLKYYGVANPAETPTLRLSTREINILAQWNI